jgi:hypothetical protein
MLNNGSSNGADINIYRTGVNYSERLPGNSGQIVVEIVLIFEGVFIFISFS